MKKIIFLLAGVFLTFFAPAQSGNKEDKYIDSLRNLQAQGKTDSIKARASFLVGHYFYYDSARAIKELDMGLRLSKNDKYLKALYQFYYAGLFYTKEPQKAIDLYELAIDQLAPFKFIESYEFQSRAWANIGAQYKFMGEDKIAIDLLVNKSIPLAHAANNTVLLGRYYNNMGMTLSDQNDLDAADDYFQKSLGFYTGGRNSDDVDHIDVLINICKNYLRWSKPELVKPFLDQAITLGRQHKDDPIILGIAETEILYQIDVKNFSKAQKIINEAIPVAKQFNMDYDLTSLYFQQYKVFFYQKKYKEAKASLELAMRTDPSKMAANLVRFYTNMAELYAKTGDYKQAYEWSTKSSALKDSVYHSDSRQAVNMIDRKLKLSEKERQIVLLKAEKKETSLVRKNQKLINWLLGIGAAIFLMAFILAVYIYRNRQQRTVLKLKELEKQKELELTRAMLEGEERERRRIARDLHDGLGGTLSGIKIKLSGMPNKPAAPLIDQAIGQLEQAIGELRSIARNMMPETLIRSGLQVALRDLCVSLSSEKTTIEFQSNGAPKEIAIPSQVNIYRIIQELIANAIRHGKAAKILVQCLQHDNHFLLTVEDNGKGFDPEQPLASRGIGLINIQNRVNLMKGKMQIDAALNEGTTVNIELYG